MTDIPYFLLYLSVRTYLYFLFFFILCTFIIFFLFRPINEQLSNFCSQDHTECLVLWACEVVYFCTIFWQIFTFCVFSLAPRRWLCISAVLFSWSWEWEWLLLWACSCGKGILWAMLLWIGSSSQPWHL